MFHEATYHQSIQFVLRGLIITLTCGVTLINAAPLIDVTDRISLAPVVARLGPDRPASGRSSFDALFTTSINGAWVYDVPYPV